MKTIFQSRRARGGAPGAGGATLILNGVGPGREVEAALEAVRRKALAKNIEHQREDARLRGVPWKFKTKSFGAGYGHSRLITALLKFHNMGVPLNAAARYVFRFSYELPVYELDLRTLALLRLCEGILIGKSFRAVDA
ncbi:hypothetical protein EDC01DRAFT_776919 [Geopyxis carbonaria]|nr:hypothetical protein EDC01DRAFT_776919 [Geopyxis carbonaria]